MGAFRRIVTRTLAVILVAGLIAPTPTAQGQMLDPPSYPPAPEAQAAAPEPTPARRVSLLTSDPKRAPHAISDRLVELIDATPAGEEIDVVAYFVGSPDIGAALREAVRRGVRVQVVMAGNAKSRRLVVGERLLRFLQRHRADGDWAMRSTGAARGTGGITHQKTWRFSRSGAARWVVVTGSYNASALSDRYGYAHMWEISGEQAVYDAFASIFRAQQAQRPLAHPLTVSRGIGWSAYFLPFEDPTPQRDPVMRRLASIPAGPSTTISIEMYSMWGPRGEWIGRRLARMAAAGARITLLAGPWVDPIVQRLMARGGVRVRSACFADHTYTHAKEMAATWLRAGRRTWWTWVGSDNWTSQGTTDDEAVLGLAGRGPYDAYAAAFDVVRRRQGVPTASCAPRVD